MLNPLSTVHSEAENDIFRAVLKSATGDKFAGGTLGSVYFSRCFIYGIPVISGLNCHWLYALV